MLYFEDNRIKEIKTLEDGQVIKCGKYILIYQNQTVYQLGRVTGDLIQFTALSTRKQTYVGLATSNPVSLIHLDIDVMDTELEKDYKSLQLHFNFMPKTYQVWDFKDGDLFRYYNGAAIYHRLGGPEIEMIFDSRGKFCLPEKRRFQNETAKFVPVGLGLSYYEE